MANVRRERELEIERDRALELSIGRDADWEIQEERGTDNYSMYWTGALHVPPGVIQDGYEGRWINHSIKGEHNSRYEQALQQGFRPVPRSRDPNLYVNLGQKDYICTEFISTRDVVLMEIPIELAERHRREQAQRTANQLKGAARHITYDNSPSYPSFNNNIHSY